MKASYHISTSARSPGFPCVRAELRRIGRETMRMPFSIDASDILVVSDRPDRSRWLAEEIASIAACRVIGTNARLDHIGDIRGVVADVDLQRSESKRCLRKFSGKAIAPDAVTPGIPLIYLVRSSFAETSAEARRLGATICLPAHSAPRTIVCALAQAIWPGKSLAELVVRREAQRVGLLVDEMLASAGAGGRIDLPGVEAAIAPVLSAIAEGGLGHWLDAVWAHDERTFQHCLLVAGITAHFARYLSLPSADKRLMTRAALVHDVGKARVPPEILNKPGKLDPDEMALMRTHAPLGEAILRASGETDPLTLDVTRHHHEMLDGSGYPDALVGDQIADPVRLLTICDIYSALIERRSYKPPMPSRDALAILDGMHGKLEARLVQAFAESVRGMP